MRRSGGAAAVVTAVVLALAPATAALAAPVGDAAHPPTPAAKSELAAAKKAKAKAKAKAKKLGDLVVCNHTGYVFGVYADGPSIREDDVAGSFDECTNWKPVKIGEYQIGFSMRTAGQPPVMIEARINRKGVTYYRTFNSQESLDANVGAQQVTRIDLFIPQA